MLIVRSRLVQVLDVLAAGIADERVRAADRRLPFGGPHAGVAVGVASPALPGAIRGRLVRRGRSRLNARSTARGTRRSRASPRFRESGVVEASRLVRDSGSIETSPIRPTRVFGSMRSCLAGGKYLLAILERIVERGKVARLKSETALTCTHPRECSQLSPPRYDPSRSRDAAPARRYDTEAAVSRRAAPTASARPSRRRPLDRSHQSCS